MLIFLRVLILVVLSLPMLSYADECTYEVHPGKVKRIIPLTSNLARLKTILLPMNLAHPEADVKVRLNHGDYRLLSIPRKGIEFPLPQEYGELDQKTICRLGSRLIEAAGGDWIESEEWIELASKVHEYAEAYNAVIVEQFRAGEIPIKNK